MTEADEVPPTDEQPDETDGLEQPDEGARPDATPDESPSFEGDDQLPPPPTETPGAARRLPRRARLLVAAAGVATLATRLPGLTHPRILVFDEVYYATQGLEIAEGGVETGHTVHPPLAKWLIGAGIRVFGFDAFGWRIVPLLAGVVVVMATVYAAIRLLDNLWLAAFAGLIVLTDGVSFTTGRLALLDGILAAFTTVALAALAFAVSRPLDVPLRRRVTWIVALSLGCGAACKWSAGPLLLVALAVLAKLTWSATPSGRARRVELARVAAIVLAVPVAVYAVTYLPTIVNFDDSAIGRHLCDKTGDCDPSLAARVAAIYHDHQDVLEFHRNLEPTNPYAHSAVSWVFQTEPVGLVKTHCPSPDPVCSPSDPPGSVRRLITIGNPMIWALATLALLVVTVLALWRLNGASGLVVGWALGLWLPWVLFPRPGYLFYASPLVPALGITMAFAVRELRGRWRPAIGGAVVAIALVGAVALYPTWTGRPTDQSYLVDLVDH